MKIESPTSTKDEMVEEESPLGRKLNKIKPAALIESTMRFGRPAGERRLNPGLIIGILFFLSVGVATLAFWYLATTTGLVNLSESAAYLVRSAGLAGLMIGILGLFIVVSAFRRAALPIADLVAGTERLAGGEYDIAVNEQGPREVRVLTRAFNVMADQLKTRDATERNLSTEVAREVMTSINALRQSLDDLDQGTAEQYSIALSRAERLSRLGQDVNTLALARNGQLALASEPTDLCVLVPDTISSLHVEASSRGVALHADVPDPALFFVTDPRRFRQILRCLLLNALARSPEGSDIQVELSELRKPTQVQLQVVDHGAAIPPEDLPFIFDHLSQRNEIATGLELVVVNQLVQAEKGEVIATSTIDQGTTISVVLPLDTPRL